MICFNYELVAGRRPDQTSEKRHYFGGTRSALIDSVAAMKEDAFEAHSFPHKAVVTTIV